MGKKHKPQSLVANTLLVLVTHLRRQNACLCGELNPLPEGSYSLLSTCIKKAQKNRNDDQPGYIGSGCLMQNNHLI